MTVVMVDLPVDAIIVVSIFCNLVNAMAGKVADEPWATAQAMDGQYPQINRVSVDIIIDQSLIEFL